MRAYNVACATMAYAIPEPSCLARVLALAHVSVIFQRSRAPECGVGDTRAPLRMPSPCYSMRFSRSAVAWHCSVTD